MTEQTHDLGAVAHLVEQLWAPLLADGDVRISVDRPGAGDAGWRDLERYRALPSIDSASMLLPAANPQVLAGSLLNFRALRARGPRAQREVLGRAARAGLPLPFPMVRLQTRLPEEKRPMLPTEQVAAALRLPRVHASVGIRPVANRKATLQLVDDAGAPVGFAKFAWERTSAESVGRETAALAELGGGTDLLRTPRLLAAGSWHGQPWLVSEPLPLSSRRPDPDGLPSAQELFALCPVVRVDRLDDSGQFQALRARVAVWRATGVEAELLAAVDRLLADVAHLETPIAARWHGDLTAWNCGRDEHGQLWCWDWESTEPDAVAGLDALHWTSTSRTLRGERYGAQLLAAALAQATPLLTAAGHSAESRAAVPAVYAAALVERAVALTLGFGGWDDGWLRRDEAAALVAAAHHLVDAHLDGRVHHH